jgi:hypothetical protein
MKIKPHKQDIIERKFYTILYSFKKKTTKKKNEINVHEADEMVTYRMRLQHRSSMCLSYI